MRPIVWITTAGDLRFLEKTLESLRKHTPEDHRLCLLCDVHKAPDLGQAVRRMAINAKVGFVMDNSGNGLNAMWDRCVRVSHEWGYKVCIVCNDDIYFTPGWLGAINRVFEFNPHVALCGIPAHGGWHEGNMARARWFHDPTLFDDPHIWMYKDEPVKYEPWTSGFLWACRPLPWIQSCGVGDGMFFGYGEPMMGLNCWRNDLAVASIYCPLIFHYGGGAAEHVHSDAERSTYFSSRSGTDAQVFAAKHGTAELDVLLRKWKDDFDPTRWPELFYEPQVPAI